MKSIILYNIPDGATSADCIRLAGHFGLRWFGFDFEPNHGFTPEGRLYGMSREITTAEQCGLLSYIQFITAALEFNNKIKRTPWARINPPCIGEWNASIHTCEHSKRWWDGKFWSIAYDDFDSEETKNLARTTRAVWQYSSIRWRGLIEQPITAGFVK